MKKAVNQFLSVFLAFALVLSLMPTLGISAAAAGTNHAPTAANTSVAFPAITEDDNSNTGIPVSDLLSLAGASDADGNTLSIAVTSVDNANGIWQCYYNGSWDGLTRYKSSVSDANVYLVPNGCSIRFLPGADFNGQAFFTFRVWDETSGTADNSDTLASDSNTIIDASGSNNGGSTAFSAQTITASINVTSVNDAPEIHKAELNNVIRMDGTNDYVQVPGDLGLNDDSFTVEGWIKACTPDYASTTFSRFFEFANAKGEDTGYNLWAGFDGTTGNMEFEAWDGSDRATQAHAVKTTEQLELNCWKYVSIVYNSSAQKGYIYWDGVLKASGNMPLTNTTRARQYSYFGRSLWLPNDAFFNGQMRNISVWKEARTAGEVASDMNTSFSGAESNLVLYYPVTDTVGSAVVTSTTNSNNGNLMEYSSNNGTESSSANSEMITNDDTFYYQVTGFAGANIPVDQMYLKDIDAGAAGVSLTLTAGSGTLAINATDGVTGSGGTAASTLTLSGTVEDINAALRTLTYKSDSTCADTITASVTDNGNTGSGGEKTASETIGVTVTAVPENTPTITVQPPVSQTVKPGETATFSVTAIGTGALSYQWQKSADGGTTWTDISGATDTNYTTPATTKDDNGSQYRCNVCDAASNTSVMSDKATLTVSYPALKMAKASPANGATGVAVNTKLSMTFSESVTAGSGNIYVDTPSATLYTIDVTKSNVSINGSTVTVTLPGNLDYISKYYILIDEGAFKDVNGTAYDGLTDASAWCFTTAPAPDTTAPTLTGFTPSNGALSVAVGTQLTMTFSEPVKAANGKNITVCKASDNSVAQTVPVSVSNVSVSGNTVTVTLPEDLEGKTKYYVLIGSGAFTDVAGNPYAGLSNNAAWAFTTADASTAGPGITLGSATNDSGKYYYKSATVKGSSIKTILLSFSESVKDGDMITLPTDTTGFTVSDTSMSNNYTKRINIDTSVAGTDDAAAVQAYIRGIGFTLASAHTSQSVKVTITTVDVQYDTFYDVDTQHYYQYVPGEIAWTDAYTAAEGMTYMGRTGYLATITSLDEDTFVNSLSGGKVGWLGGTALNHKDTSGTLYYSGFDADTANEAGGSDWYWACGPERGTTFYTGRTPTRNNQNGNDPYWNWYSGEPNNSNSNENCLTTLPYEGDTGNRAGLHTSTFSWNDIIWNDANEGAFAAQGYFVEFGNMSPGTNETVDTRFASVTGSLNSSASTYTASISGQTVSGQILTAELTGGTASAYQWMRGETAISGATAQTYTLTGSDVGCYISVKITVNGTTVTSPQVGPVTTKPVITATADNANNCVKLHWTAGGDHYMVYQKGNGETIYQSIPVSTDIKVLNVYPDNGTSSPLTGTYGNTATSSNSLKTWMNATVPSKAYTMGSPLVNGTQYNMAVTDVSLSAFKNNPSQYLGTPGNYNYDVVFFGSWDCNGGNTESGDLNDASETAMEQFINYGGGCLSGHDTSILINNDNYYHPCFNKLMGLFDISMEIGGGYGETDTTKTCDVSVAKKGLLTNYPYQLNSILTVPACHTNGQVANGDIWMRFSGDAAARNFYLTTWNNTAMIQTGHSNGAATEDEQKIITNTLYYLAQVTQSTSASDHTAQDLAAPDAVADVTAQSAANTTSLHWTAPADNGNTYDYKVKEFTSADESNYVESDPTSATVTTGVKGYYVLIDTNASATADAVKTANHFVTANSYATATSDLTTGTNYAHIMAVDNAGNESAVTTQEFTVSAVSPIVGSGSALTFDGADDYVAVPTISAYTTSNFTVEAWVQLNTANSHYNGIIDKGRNSGNNWYLLSSDSGKGVVVGMQGSSSELSYSWNDSNWHHVCITCDGSTFALYVDGIQRSSTTVRNYAPVDSTITFGRRAVESDNYTSYYTGNLDEVKLWNTARTQDEIRTDMYSHSAYERGLVGYWSFDEGTGTTAADLTGNHNNGTLTNMDSGAWVNSPAWQNRVTTENAPLIIDAGYTWDSGAATFSTKTNASHGSLSYDNEKNTVMYTPAAEYSGQDTFTYTMTENGVAKDYTVNMTVVQKPVITTQPVSQTIAAGSGVTFSVVVNTPPSGTLSYQWQKKDSNGTWGNIKDATGNTYEISTVAATDAGDYQCVVTNTAGAATTITTSSPATLTVTFAATVKINLDGAASNTPTVVVLKQSGNTKATLSGTNGVYAANVVNGTYDVYVNDADTGIDIEINNAANSVTLNYYTVSFAVTSSGAASGSSISATYDNEEIRSGDIVLGGKTLILTATGEGIGVAQSSSYAYAWSGDGITGASGQSAQALTITSLSGKVNAVCTVTGSAAYAVTLNKNGGTIASDKNVTVYAYGTGATLPTGGDITKTGSVFGGWYAASDFSGNAVPAIGTTDKGAKEYWAKWVQAPVLTGPENVTAAAGSKADFNVTVTAPENGTLTYQWQKYNGSSWDNITDATSATYTIASVKAGDVGQYHCVVTNTEGSTTAVTTSNAATLTVTFTAKVTVMLDGTASNDPVGTGVVLKQDGSSDVKLDKTTTDGVYTANVINGTYNVWVNGMDTGTDIVITDKAADAAVNYYTVNFSVLNAGAADGSTVSATSNNVDIGTGAIVLAGKKIILTATGKGIGTAQSSSYTYAWSGNGITGASGQSTQALTITSLGDKVNTVCTVTGSATYAVTLNKNGGTIASDKNVTVYTYGTGATLPTSGDITKTGSVFGGWYAASDFSGNAVPAIGATDKGTKEYWAKWVQAPALTGPENVTAAAGSKADFNVTVTAPENGTLTYQWQKYNGSSWDNITDATGATYTVASVKAGDMGQYHCVVTNTDGSTTAITTSNAATLTVTFMAKVTVQLDGAASITPVGTGKVELKQGGDTKAELNGSGGVYTANIINGTYDVYVNGADTGIDIEISNTANSVTVNYYTVNFSVLNAGAADGSTVSATSNNEDINSGAIVLAGKKIVLTAIGDGIGTAQSSSYAYAWSGDGITGASGQSTQALTITSLSGKVNAVCTVTGSASYKVTLNTNSGTIHTGNVTVYTYGAGATLPTDVTRSGYVFGGWYPTNSDFSGSAVTDISHTDKGAKTFYAKWVQNPAIGTQPVSQTIAEGAPVSFNVGVTTPESGTISYQWQKYDGTNWNNISGATDATYTITNVRAGDAGPFRCIVTHTDGVSATTASNAATLTVVFEAKVTINKNGSASPGPVTGDVQLKQGTETKATLSGTSGVYTANVINGTYDVYVNGENIGQTITINNAASNTTINYYTVSFSATDAGTASGSSVSATVGDTEISNGAIVLKGKTVVLTATGAGADYYAYFWSGSGANGQDTNLLTISSLSGKVDATCIVTGRTTAPTYSVSLNTNGGSIASGSITSYTYGVGAMLPTNVAREGYVFEGWFDNPNFSGNAVEKISITDMGDKAFYAKWRLFTIGGEVSDDDGPVSGATVTIRGNNIVSQSKETDSEGKYSFSSIPKGEYNIIATYYDTARNCDITTTIIIRVVDKDISNAKIVMPSAGAENSIVTIAQHTPDVVVGYLDQQFTDDDDTYVGTLGNTVKIELAVEQKNEENAKNDGTAAEIQSVAGGRTVDMYLDMTLKKTMSSSSSSSSPAQILETDSLLKIIIPYDLSGKTNIKVYRVHEGTPEAMTEKAYSPDTQTSECFMVDTANKQIIVWTQKFSTYAVAYSTISNSSYAITASAGTGGSISPSGSVSVTAGSSKTFTVTANEGYTVSDVLVDGKSVGAVGSYTFTNIQASHTISAVFTKAKGLPYYLSSSGAKVFIGFASDKSGSMKYIAPKGVTVKFMPNPKNFTDISGHWAKPYIDYITERETFVGTAKNRFSPDIGMTRAMFATVIGSLYERSYGALTVSGPHAFTDCDYDSWYGPYIDWCSENGIIRGVGGGLYEPNREITREEMAQILYQFAVFMGASSANYGNVSLAYPDTSSISSWATQAAKYCQQAGIIVGRDNGYFVPQGTATRAEVTVILEKYIEIIVSKKN